jgi:hypothetical protein
VACLLIAMPLGKWSVNLRLKFDSFVAPSLHDFIRKSPLDDRALTAPHAPKRPTDPVLSLSVRCREGGQLNRSTLGDLS